MTVIGRKLLGCHRDIAVFTSAIILIHDDLLSRGVLQEAETTPAAFAWRAQRYAESNTSITRESSPLLNSRSA
jgi:hypothetical protein